MKYPYRETIKGLSFTCRKLAKDLWILDERTRGCRPMNLHEMEMWKLLSKLKKPGKEQLE